MKKVILISHIPYDWDGSPRKCMDNGTEEKLGVLSGKIQSLDFSPLYILSSTQDACKATVDIVNVILKVENIYYLKDLCAAEEHWYPEEYRYSIAKREYLEQKIQNEVKTHDVIIITHPPVICTYLQQLGAYEVASGYENQSAREQKYATGVLLDFSADKPLITVLWNIERVVRFVQLFLFYLTC